MKTMRLWLEPDRESGAFHRLRYAWTDVPLREVLLHGIHPWQGPYAHTTLLEALAERLNDPQVKPEELAAHRYCPDLHPGSGYYPYSGSSPLDRFLEQIARRAYFVERELGYAQLLTLSQERLRGHWTGHTVRDLLGRLNLDFNGLRRFLKARSPDVRLQGYADLGRYDFSELLSLDDFGEQPDLLIGAAFPGAVFRLTSLLSKATDEAGRLSLLPEIWNFGVRMPWPASGYPYATLTYAGHREGEAVRLIPHLSGRSEERDAARQIAAHWSGGRARYCFHMELEQLCQLVESGGAEIDFAGLTYVGQPTQPRPQARLCSIGATPFTAGAPLRIDDRAEELRGALRAYGVSQSGNKAQLAHKLASLSARVYGEHEQELDEYFSGQRFIRVGGAPGQMPRRFPVLGSCALRDTVLSMYLLRHLRGDAIADAGYVDDSYDLEDLARALIEGRVSLSGTFLKAA